MKLFFICILLLLSGCGSPDSDGSSAQDPSLPPRTTVTEFLLPSADGTDVYGNDFVSIDASNTSEGYVMVRYTGPADKSRLQMTAPDGTLYSYFLKPGDYQTFPLSGGRGPPAGRVCRTDNTEGVPRCRGPCRSWKIPPHGSPGPPAGGR